MRETPERIARMVAAARIAQRLQMLVPPGGEQEGVADLRTPGQEMGPLDGFDSFRLHDLQRSQRDVQIDRRADVQIRFDPGGEGIPL